MRYVLVMLALTGCATQEMVWYKPGAGNQAFNMDAAACKAQAFSVAGMPLMQVAIVYTNCMYGKGWEQVPAR